MERPASSISAKPLLAAVLCIVGATAVALAHDAGYANGLQQGLVVLASWAVFAVLTAIGLSIILVWAARRPASHRGSWAVIVMVAVASGPAATWVAYWWWPTPRSIVQSIRNRDGGELRKAEWIHADLNAPEAYEMGFGGHMVGDTPLTASVRADDLTTVRNLLAHGASPSAPDGHRSPPIAVAAQAGDPAIVALLVAGGADVDATDAGGRTALYWAAGLWHPAIVQTLLAAGASTVPSESLYKQTALQVAVVGHVNPYEGNPPDPDPAHRLRCIQLLRDAGAKVDAPDRQGQTPLALAATAGDAAAVAILTATSASRASPVDALAVALGQRDNAAAIAVLDRTPRDLLEIQQSPYRGSTLLVAALKSHMLALVQYLLDHHVFVSDIALRTAVDAGDPSAIESLVAESGSPGHLRWGRPVSWDYVLSVAAYKGQLPTARLAVAHGASVRAEVAGILPNVRQTPLHSAAAVGHVDLMAFLVDAGADLNAYDEGDSRSPSVLPNTPLDIAIVWASAEHRQDTIQWLLRHGAFANNGIVPDNVMKAAGIDPNRYYADVAARRRAWNLSAKLAK